MMELMRRHTVVGIIGVGLVYLFWLSRPDWVAEMRFWRSVGDASLIFLYLTLILGPAVRLLPEVGKLLPYRRELGIWFGLFAIFHTYLIFDGWVSWDVLQFLGYVELAGADQPIRLESGFGMANLMGLLAVVIALPLMATSTDWAMRALGGGAWKFLHYSSYIIFYMVVLHTAYFLYIHFTMSFHRPPPPDTNWAQIPFAILTAGVIGLQVWAFVATVRRRRVTRARVTPT